MKSFLKIGALVLALASLQACTRIETGEVGLRVGFDKQVKNEELLPGSFNQTIVGSVMTFPVKEVAVKVDDLTPQAKDNSTMKDFDAILIYNINQAQVAELYNTKNKSFHANHNGDTYLMYNYIFNAARNAVYKAARQYDALDMGDNRQAIEQFVKETVTKTLADEKLDGTITITQVLVRNIVPADSIVASANELVKAKNELKTEEIKVATAKKRNESMQANPTMIPLMKAEAEAQYLRDMPAAIANFKGNTLIIGSGAQAVVPVGGK